jgi:hypothetical protein
MRFRWFFPWSDPFILEGGCFTVSPKLARPIVEGLIWFWRKLLSTRDLLDVFFWFEILQFESLDELSILPGFLPIAEETCFLRLPLFRT